MDVRGLGDYIREQRRKSRLTLRKLSGAAGVSMPYLSQVERGLRKPSAEILQGIAKGLRVSAETLYVKAGILEDRPVPDVISSLMSDPTITERQKQALIEIYRAFREEAGRADGAVKPPTRRGGRVASPRSPSKPPGSATSKRSTNRTTKRTSTKEV